MSKLYKDETVAYVVQKLSLHIRNIIVQVVKADSRLVHIQLMAFVIESENSIPLSSSFSCWMRLFCSVDSELAANFATFEFLAAKNLQP